MTSIIPAIAKAYAAELQVQRASAAGRMSGVFNALTPQDGPESRDLDYLPSMKQPNDLRTVIDNVSMISTFHYRSQLGIDMVFSSTSSFGTPATRNDYPACDMRAER